MLSSLSSAWTNLLSWKLHYKCFLNGRDGIWIIQPNTDIDGLFMWPVHDEASLHPSITPNRIHWCLKMDWSLGGVGFQILPVIYWTDFDKFSLNGQTWNYIFWDNRFIDMSATKSQSGLLKLNLFLLIVVHRHVL